MGFTASQSQDQALLAFFQHGHYILSVKIQIFGAHGVMRIKVSAAAAVRNENWRVSLSSHDPKNHREKRTEPKEQQKLPQVGAKSEEVSNKETTTMAENENLNFSALPVIPLKQQNGATASLKAGLGNIWKSSYSIRPLRKQLS